MENGITIKKNLYDLDYHRTLNYFTVSLIVLATIWITFIFNFEFPENAIIEIEFKLMSTFIVLFVAIVLFFIFGEKLKKIK